MPIYDGFDGPQKSKEGRHIHYCAGRFQQKKSACTENKSLFTIHSIQFII